MDLGYSFNLVYVIIGSKQDFLHTISDLNVKSENVFVK